ncbi:MAG: penicillin-insensitive murein endopeptidase [Myxococcota bacterium]
MAFAAEFGPALEGEWIASEEPAPADTAAWGCSDQYLQDGVELPDLPLFYVKAQPDHSWGSPEMVDLLVEAGRHMSWLLPGASPFVIGDISRRHGGHLAGHITHRAGIDVDIGIYKKGAWQHKNSFTTLAPSELDLEANWALVSTLLDSGKVDFILLDRAHIARLRAYALKKGLLTEEEADRVMPADGRGHWADVGVLRHAPHHQDHIHVRVLCGDGTRAGDW